MSETKSVSTSTGEKHRAGIRISVYQTHFDDSNTLVDEVFMFEITDTPQDNDERMLQSTTHPKIQMHHVIGCLTHFLNHLNHINNGKDQKEKD